MQNLIHQLRRFTMSKTIAARRPKLSTTSKWVVGLTIFFFIAKSLSTR